MRQTIVLFLLVILLAPAVAAQPQYGDLVITTGHGAAGNVNGYTGYLNPANPSTLTTLSNAPYGSFHNWVRMAPDNTDLVYTRVTLQTVPNSGALMNLQPSGIRTTIASFSGINTDGYELDHDGQWILSARSPPLSPKPNYVLGVDHTTGATTTFASLFSTTWFNEIAIDRDPGSMPYTLVCCCLSGTSGPEVLQADRQGHVTTVLAGSVIPANTAIELDPRTGDYIIGYIGNGNIIRMTKSGTKTTLTAFSGNAIKILQDDTAWIAHGGWTFTNAPPFRPVHQHGSLALRQPDSARLESDGTRGVRQQDPGVQPEIAVNRYRERPEPSPWRGRKTICPRGEPCAPAGCACEVPAVRERGVPLPGRHGSALLSVGPEPAAGRVSELSGRSRSLREQPSEPSHHRADPTVAPGRGHHGLRGRCDLRSDGCPPGHQLPLVRAVIVRR